jgi:hypothetical protein
MAAIGSETISTSPPRPCLRLGATAAKPGEEKAMPVTGILRAVHPGLAAGLFPTLPQGTCADGAARCAAPISNAPKRANAWSNRMAATSSGLVAAHRQSQRCDN